jgi:hypothetical protein
MELLKSSFRRKVFSLRCILFQGLKRSFKDLIIAECFFFFFFLFFMNNAPSNRSNSILVFMSPTSHELLGLPV